MQHQVAEGTRTIVRAKLMTGSPVVSAGPVGYGYQVPYAAKIKSEAGLMSMASPPGSASALFGELVQSIDVLGAIIDAVGARASRHRR